MQAVYVAVGVVKLVIRGIALKTHTFIARFATLKYLGALHAEVAHQNVVTGIGTGCTVAS